MRAALREALWVAFGLACTAAATVVPVVLWIAPAVTR